MGNGRNSSTKVYGLIAGIMAITAVAVWQFYRFVTFTNAQGNLDQQGGRIHLWLALAMAVLACIVAFFVFSVFMRHDHDDDLHITSRQ